MTNYLIRVILNARADENSDPYIDYSSNSAIAYKKIQTDVEDPYGFFYNNFYMLVEYLLGVVDGLACIAAHVDA
ncbi:MAG: hypothetical protein P8H39_09910 [Thalassotalea sp.]|nr:hypothetical protein [Thalassotalea sp.]